MSTLADHYRNLAKQLSESFTLGLVENKLITTSTAGGHRFTAFFPSGVILTLTEGQREKAFEALRSIVADLLCGALEGGSNYWYQLDRIGDKYLTDGIIDYGKITEDKDLAMKVYDYYNPGEELGTLTQESIQNALLKLVTDFPEHFTDAVNGDWDGDTADVFFQLAVMGELTFG
jgi:hypothetical protein